MGVIRDFYRTHGWGQGRQAADADGSATSTRTPSAVSFCLRGACDRIAYDDRTESCRHLLESVRAALKREVGRESIIMFNDTHGRTAAHIMAFLDKYDL